MSRSSLRKGLACASLLAAIVACGTTDDAPTRERDGIGTRASALDISVFQLPPSSTAARAAIVAKYAHLDPKDEIPRGLLEDAMAFFDVNQAHIPKKKYFVVVDFKPFSGKDRFFLVDLATGAVEKHKVAHGDGTDPDNDGYADVFGNVDGSHMSSLGFYLTGEIYDGTHIHSMRLDGLTPDGSPNGMANTNVRDRLIVVHEATYVNDASTAKQGRSNGCLALDPDIEVAMVDRIHDGTLVYGALSPLNPPIGKVGPGAGGSAGAGGGSTAGAPTTGGGAGAPTTGGGAGAPTTGGAPGASGSPGTSGSAGTGSPGEAGGSSAGAAPGTGGSSSEGGSSSSGPGGLTLENSETEESSGCSVGTPTPGGAPGLFALVAAGLLAVRRRRAG